MVVARRFLMGGGGAFTVQLFPTSWGVSRYGGNPVIPVGGGETSEQYDPAPIQMGNGDIWAYVKGATAIYAYKSTDAGVTFVVQNAGSAVILPGAGGTWDDTYTLEPAALYDSVNDVIHLWYKGSTGGANDWAWGHATAPGATPTVFTKDAANPILTSAAISTKMGGLTVSDTAPFDVIVDGSTYHFYGYVAYNSIYQIVHMTGTSWSTPDVSTLTTILTPGVSTTIAVTGSVFTVAGAHPPYGMLYTWGPLTGSGRSIRVGTSNDLTTWNFSDTTDIMSPTSGWESYHVYTPRVLRASTAPYLAPIIDGSNRWKLYYSGADAGWAHSQTGLAYLTPT